MNLIEKIKALFASEEVKEEKYLDAKLVDGTIIRTDAEEFKPGDKLSVITEDGQVIKAPEGMHETTDGTVIVVDAEGIITEVRKPEAEVEEEMSETSDEKTEEVKVEAAEIEIEGGEGCPEADRIGMLEEKLKMLEEAVGMLVSGIEMKKEEIESVKAENAALKIKNEELSKVPAATPAKTKKFEKTETVKSNSNLISKISDLREKNKN